MANVIKRTQGGGEGGGAKSDNVHPAGIYILALVALSRRTAESGTSYLRTTWRIINPARLAGKTMFLTMFTNTAKEGTRRRWEGWTDAAGVEEVDVDSDRSIKDAFLGRGVKVQISRDEQNGYAQNDIQYFVFPSKYTDADRDAILVFEQEWKAKRSSGGGRADWAPPDDTGGSSDDPGPSDEDGYSRAEPVDDEEIPF